MENKEDPLVENYGTLFVVSTPIGNLEDITLRALKILNIVTMIAAENVIHTTKLCKHYEIKTELMSYNQHNRRVKAPELIRLLKKGNDLAMVTDAGTPGISDPGNYLVNQALKDKIQISPIPGPSAVAAAISVSGLAANSFIFAGFLPNKTGKRKKELKKLAFESRTLIFFEAPHRIKAMLIDLKEIFGERQMVMVREMTKMFEEVKKDSVSNILNHLESRKIRGEFTLVVEGWNKRNKFRGLNADAAIRLDKLLNEQKMSVKDIAILISREEGCSYREIYKDCLIRKKVPEGSKQNGIKQKA
ncbi:MAG: 16S rRNA (cytidine(1402)-2'-O)-methyltransferase [Deltaproteobacteria bacterium]|nr:16S rRNA (cytidine(1402)-2'-O)-methyltransferase [Deltaproteobacteria bacterium]